MRLPCLTAEHEGHPTCCAILCFGVLSMCDTCAADMPRQLKGASIHSLPSELLGKVFAGVDMRDR